MNQAIDHWQVQVQGSGSDLEHLEKYFSSGSQRFQHDKIATGFLYGSDRFEGCTDSNQVLKIAEEELLILSGVLKVARESRDSLKIGGVFRMNANGRRDIFVHIHEGARATAEVGVLSVSVTGPDGKTITNAPSPRTVILSRVALEDAAVTKAMRLLAAPDSESWVSLYRLYEVVKADVGGEQALKQHAWGSTTDFERFRRSANSVTVAGDRARHGSENTQPPTKPMTVEEAVAFVNYIVNAWLATKGV